MEYFVALWIACSVVTYGYSFGYFQRKFKYISDEQYRSDMLFCGFMSLFGPLSLAGYFAAFQKEGFRYGFKSW